MKDKINPRLEVGDRIVLIMMPGEDAVSYGDRGKVIKVNNASSFIQYFIEWDNGSTLAMIEDIGDKSNVGDRWMKEDVFEALMNHFQRFLVLFDFLRPQPLENALLFVNIDFHKIFLIAIFDPYLLYTKTL